MIFKRLRTAFFALAIVSMAGLNAQNLNVLEKGGTQTSLSIHNIRSLIFQSENLNINLRVGPPVSFMLSNLRNLTFSPLTGIENPIPPAAAQLQIFPNPVQDILNINLNSDDNLTYEAKIFTIDGRVVLSQRLVNNTELHTLTVSSLEKGLYYLVLSNSKQIQSAKFFKN